MENIYQKCPQCIGIFSQSYVSEQVPCWWRNLGMRKQGFDKTWSCCFSICFLRIMKAEEMCTPSTLVLEGGAAILSNESRREWRQRLPVLSRLSASGTLQAPRGSVGMDVKEGRADTDCCWLKVLCSLILTADGELQ